MPVKNQVKGGAATAISADGDIKLVFKLDKAWINNINRIMLFNPSLGDIKLSVNVIVEGVTMTYSIDHQTWPTTHTHNGKTHVFDETSPIRLQSMNGSVDDVDKLSEAEIEVWKAKHLVGREWEEDVEGGKGKQPAVEAESQHPRSRPTRSRSPHFAESSQGDSENQAKRRKADAIIGTTHDKAGSAHITTCDSEGEGGIPQPDKSSTSDMIQTGGRVPAVPVSSLVPVPPQTPAQPMPLAQKQARVIEVMISDGQIMYLSITRRITRSRFVEAVLRHIGREDEENDVRVTVDDETWEPYNNIGDIGLWDDLVLSGSTAPHTRLVYVSFAQIGGKPVIYLYPAQPMSVDVTLSLCPQWSISAVHPPTPVLKPDSTQTANDWERVKWTVDADIDGSMVDKATGLEVSYLFWEAETQGGGTKETHNHETKSEIKIFEPCYTRLSPDQSNIIVLPSSDVSLYLDRALKVLGLHTEARTSFITYWLPHYQRHPYIALTFLPQEEYSKAAPLDISPRPDIVTRVFMLFQKVDVDQLDNWAGAILKAEEDVGFWRDIVGVESRERQEDSNLFRVLEWGGMEII